MKSPRTVWSVGLTALAVMVTLVLKTVVVSGYPWWLVWLATVNVVVALAFVLDKEIAVRVADRAPAERGKARVPECALLWLSLIGGSVGALVAMLGRRHKTLDRDFLLRYGFIVVLHAIALGILVGWWMFRGSRG